jgi:hypothetical protein
MQERRRRSASARFYKTLQVFDEREQMKWVGRRLQEIKSLVKSARSFILGMDSQRADAGYVRSLQGA